MIVMGDEHSLSQDEIFDYKYSRVDNNLVMRDFVSLITKGGDSKTRYTKKREKVPRLDYLSKCALSKSWKVETPASVMIKLSPQARTDHVTVNGYVDFNKGGMHQSISGQQSGIKLRRIIEASLATAGSSIRVMRDFVFNKKEEKERKCLAALE